MSDMVRNAVHNACDKIIRETLRSDDPRYARLARDLVERAWSELEAKAKTAPLESWFSHALMDAARQQFEAALPKMLGGQVVRR